MKSSAPRRSIRRREPRRPVDRLPLAFALVAMLVRLPQLGWGLPLVEEEALPMKKALEMCGWVSGRVTLDPNTAGWPSLSFYVHMVLQGLQYWFGRITGIYPSPPDFFAAYLLDPGPVVLIARLLSVALAGAIVGLGANLAGRLAGRAGTWIVGSLLVASPLLLDYGQRVTPDILAAFFSGLALVAILDVHERPALAPYVYAGLWIGLGASCKYTPALLLPALYAAHLLREAQLGRPSPLAALTDRRMLIAIAVAAGAFAITSPYLLLDPGMLGRGVTAQSQHLTGGHFGQVPGGIPFVGYLASVLAPGIGWPALLLSLAGLIAAVVRFRGIWWVIALAFGAGYVVLAPLPTQFDRYMLPLLLPLVLGLAGLVVTLRAMTRTLPRAVLTGIGIAVVAPAILGSIAIHRERARPSTVVLANRWFQSLPAADRPYIVAEPLSIDLPTTRLSQSLPLIRLVSVPRREALLSRRSFDLEYLPMFTVKPERSALFYDLRHFSGFDYAVVSEGVRGRYRAEPGRFPKQVAFYEDLARFGEPVFAVGGRDGARGPAIEIFRLSADGMTRLFVERGPIAPGFHRGQLADLDTTAFVEFVEGVGRAAYARELWREVELYYATLLEVARPGPGASAQLLGVLARAAREQGRPIEAEDLEARARAMAEAAAVGAR
jgi:hypothetical protein